MAYQSVVQYITSPQAYESISLQLQQPQQPNHLPQQQTQHHPQGPARANYMSPNHSSMRQGGGDQYHINMMTNSGANGSGNAGQQPHHGGQQNLSGGQQQGQHQGMSMNGGAGNDGQQTMSPPQQPTGQVNENVPPMCIRAGCTNQAVVNSDWEDEYCSNECVITHCRDVFGNWVQNNNGQQGNAFPSVVK